MSANAPPLATPPADRSPGNPWWERWLSHPLAVPALALGLLMLRVAWQACCSNMTLVEDEAHYWEWSRRLGLSYYSKGPGVAWSIWASTALFGATEWAVRLPAAIGSCMTMLGAAACARWMFPGERCLPALAALLCALVPGFAVAGMLMTIDSPYLACWMWGGAFAARAITRGGRGVWLGLGAAVAVGFLYKYTILMLIPGVALSMWWTRGQRPPIDRAGVLGAVLVASLGLVPVALWNAHHDWATVRHLMGHLGMHGGDTEHTAGYGRTAWSPAWLFEYLGLQAVICGPALTIAFFEWRRAERTDLASRTPARILTALAAPVFVLYLLVSLRTRTEGNWAMAGVCTLVPLAAWGVIRAVRRRDTGIRFLWGAAIVMGLGCVLAFPAVGLIRPGTAPARWIPVHRFTGMRAHAAAVAAELDRIRDETGRDPILVCDHYGRASQLAFYLPGHPVVYCASSLMGGRKTQYDLWTQTDLRDPETAAALIGRPALLLGSVPLERWERGFAGVREIGPLAGEPKPGSRTACIADRFVGYTDEPDGSDGATDAP